MAQVTGICYVRINGKLLRSKEGAKLDNIGGKTREAVVGHSVYGFTETVVAPSVEATLADTKDLKLKDIANTTDATITFETDTGKQYVLSHAWCENALSLSQGGDVEVKFTAMNCEEMA